MGKLQNPLSVNWILFKLQNRSKPAPPPELCPKAPLSLGWGAYQSKQEVSWPGLNVCYECMLWHCGPRSKFMSSVSVFIICLWGLYRSALPCTSTHMTFLVWPQVNTGLMDAGESHCSEGSQRYDNSIGYCMNSWMYSPFAVSLA